MAYQIRYVLEVVFTPDGAGPMSVASAQKLRLGSIDFAGLTVQNQTITITGQPQSYEIVTGGDAPAQSDFNLALNGATATPTGGMALDLATAIAANLTRIQGFATGGG